MKIAIASDLSGFPLKKYIYNHLIENYKNIEILNFGINTNDEYIPFYKQAEKTAHAIQNKNADAGILICGTGQGMNITANKYKGIYAGLVTDIVSAQRAKIINNTNIITMGSWITAPVMGAQIVDAWLEANFIKGMEDKKDIITEAYEQIIKLEHKNFK